MLDIVRVSLLIVCLSPFVELPEIPAPPRKRHLGSEQSLALQLLAGITHKPHVASSLTRRKCLPEKQRPWQAMPGPNTTTDLPEGRGEGRQRSGSRKHKPDATICPLQSLAARESVENCSNVNRALPPG
jgi:hypothetical protein